LLAAIVLVEKATPLGPRLSRPIGVGLGLWGGWLLAGIR
jgi:hypothetical protein